MTTDTSREAVERMAQTLDDLCGPFAEGMSEGIEAAATLRALLARAEAAEQERDAAYRRGAEAMREAVAEEFASVSMDNLAKHIRALPIPGETP